MAHKALAAALGLIAAASASASNLQPIAAEPAPAGTPDTRYCMRVEAVTGTRLEEVKCWTRAEWADKGVDVDKEWAEEGVRVIG